MCAGDGARRLRGDQRRLLVRGTDARDGGAGLSRHRPAIPTLADWQVLWAASGLQERVVRSRQIDSRAEVKDRIQWIGWPWLLRAWAWALRLIVTQPGIRQLAKQQFAVSAEMLEDLGYGFMVGRK